MKSAVKTTKCSNGLVQIETRDSVITVPATVWAACVEEEGETLQAAWAAERSPNAMVVRF